MKTQFELNKEYWELEVKLAKIADSLKVPRVELAKYVGKHKLSCRDEIVSLLYQEIDILKKIHKLQKEEILNEEVINLNKYRKIVS